MILFDESIADLLNKYFAEDMEYVESLLLASYGFNIQFVNFNIQCNERIFATLSGKSYEWCDAPNAAPWGVLGRQRATQASLKSPNLLNIAFESGDTMDIETLESKYESVVFTFSPRDAAIVVEIY